jgi:lysophospholipase L1-like esterase
MDTRLLTPIAVLQGLWLVQRTPRLPSPAGHCGRFGCGLAPVLRVVGVGDSCIAGTGVSDLQQSVTASYARQLQQRWQCEVEWRVHGVNGATSAAILHNVAPAVPAADVYLVSAGVNDAIRNVEPRRYARNLHRVFVLLRRKSPQSTILFGGLPPLDAFPALPWPLRAILAQRARALHETAVAVAARHERAYCFRFPPRVHANHFASDGFHPAEAACERWATGLLDLWPTALAPALARLEARPAQPTTRSKRAARRTHRPRPPAAALRRG